MPITSLSKEQLCKGTFYLSLTFFAVSFAPIIAAVAGVNKSEDFCNDHIEICQDQYKGHDLLGSVSSSAYASAIGIPLGVYTVIGMGLLMAWAYKHYAKKQEESSLAENEESFFHRDNINCCIYSKDLTFCLGMFSFTLLIGCITNYLTAADVSNEFSHHLFNDLSPDELQDLNHFKDDVYQSMISASFPISTLLWANHILCTLGALIYTCMPTQSIGPMGISGYSAMPTMMK